MKTYTYTTWFIGIILLVTIDCNSQTTITVDKPTSDKNHIIDVTSAPDTIVRTHKASCRCGELSITYNGPTPKRRTLCHCNSCQMRTGSAFSIQGRFPKNNLKIEGKSTAWRFPNEKGQEANYRSCDSGGATFHFCPTCGTTVYWEIDAAPDIIGIALGTLTDPSFPAPVISGFEAYGHPWAMQPAELKIIRLEYDELEEKLESKD
ncbi:GFA family protein [Carboxylicivirga sp. RSCT41]|uniref:GFA family protein n=1 Tax=Carboxylicivirga agarovorans TaxID=3417570 RepID=UPI003D34182A